MLDRTGAVEAHSTVSHCPSTTSEGNSPYLMYVAEYENSAAGEEVDWPADRRYSKNSKKSSPVACKAIETVMGECCIGPEEEGNH